MDGGGSKGRIRKVGLQARDARVVLPNLMSRIVYVYATRPLANVSCNGDLLRNMISN